VNKLYLILMRSMIDGQWEVVPDSPARDRATPYKLLANAGHTLDVLNTRDPHHQRVIVELVPVEGQDPRALHYE